MKKYLNPLLLVPILWFLIPLWMIFLGNNHYRENDLPWILLIFWPWFLWIFLLNMWNYNIVNLNKWNTYNILMTIIVMTLSWFFFSILTAPSLDGGFFVFILGFFYIIVSLILIILNISAYLSISKNILEEDSKSKNTLEEDSKLNNTLEKDSYNSFFIWSNIPLLFIVLLLIIKAFFGNITLFDIVILIPYLLILQINKNFSNAKSMYQIFMLVLLILNSAVYIYVSMSPWMRKDTWYILYFPIIRIISLILLIIVWWIDKKSQNKLISSN